MIEQSVAKQTIESIREQKLNFYPNNEVAKRIKLLQREMVKLSFQNNRKEDICLIVEEISRLRNVMKRP